MSLPATPPRYVPAIVCAEHDSPLDALLALHVPQDEALNLVTAHWHQPPGASILATVKGGRPVAVARTEGCWLSCNIYPEHATATLPEAKRRLARLVKRGRRGFIVHL